MARKYASLTVGTAVSSCSSRSSRPPRSASRCKRRGFFPRPPHSPHVARSNHIGCELPRKWLLGGGGDSLRSTSWRAWRSADLGRRSERSSSSLAGTGSRNVSRPFNYDLPFVIAAASHFALPAWWRSSDAKDALTVRSGGAKSGGDENERSRLAEITTARCAGGTKAREPQRFRSEKSQLAAAESAATENTDGQAPMRFASG